MTDKKIETELKQTEFEIHENFKHILQATNAKYVNKQLPDATDSLVDGLKEGFQPMVIDGVTIEPLNNNKNTRQEIENTEALDRARREQYEKERNFFEGEILLKSRSLCEIQDDFIKVLHPYYREKFIAGIARYGTIYAAMKYMKDNHGLKLRRDIIGRMATMIPSFKQEIDDAMEEYKAYLHMEMQRRAVEGVDRGVYHQGELVATEKVYSDALLSKMIDTHNPDYKEAKQKENKYGNQINVQIIKDFHNYKE